MRWFARYFAFSTLLAAASLSVTGGIGCADETFKCCECAFDCQTADPADPTLTVGATFYLCDCPQGDLYTYEECGIFCKQQLTQEELDARAAANQPPMSSCGRTPKQDSVLAKNSCSPGWPVGTPP